MPPLVDYIVLRPYIGLEGHKQRGDIISLRNERRARELLEAGLIRPKPPAGPAEAPEGGPTETKEAKPGEAPAGGATGGPSTGTAQSPAEPGQAAASPSSGEAQASDQATQPRRGRGRPRKGAA